MEGSAFGVESIRFRMEDSVEATDIVLLQMNRCAVVIGTRARLLSVASKCLGHRSQSLVDVVETVARFAFFEACIALVRPGRVAVRTVQAAIQTESNFQTLDIGRDRLPVAEQMSWVGESLEANYRVRA